MPLVIVTSTDGRLSWELDTHNGRLVGNLPNGARLDMCVSDVHRLKCLLVEYSEMMDKHAAKELARLGEKLRPTI